MYDTCQVRVTGQAEVADDSRVTVTVLLVAPVTPVDAVYRCGTGLGLRRMVRTVHEVERC